MKKIFIILFCITLLSCAKDKGNYDYSEVNDVEISGFKPLTLNGGMYFVKPGDKLTIPAVVYRKFDKSDNNLSYVWEIGKKRDTLSTQKTLDIVFPSHIGWGTQDSRLIVTDENTGMKYAHNFKVQVTTQFNFGFFVLCRDTDNTTEVAYLSTIKESEDAPENEFMFTKKVGDVPLNGAPVVINGTFSHISALEDYFWTLTIMTKDNNNPYIVTDCATFFPNTILSDKNFVEGDKGYKFFPTFFFSHPYGGNAPYHYFLSEGQILTYNAGFLYRPAKHEKEYYWEKLLFNWDIVCCFDKLSRKFYVLNPIPDNPSTGVIGDEYAFDQVIDIENSEDYSDKYILADYLNLYAANQPNIVVTGTNQGIRFDSIGTFGGTKPEFRKSQVCPVSGVDASSKCVFSKKGTWFFVIGSTIYSSPNILPKLDKFAELPNDLGVLTDLKLDTKENNLVMTFFDSNSPNKLKGSFVMININTKEIKTRKNCMKEPVSLFCADANAFF